MGTNYYLESDVCDKCGRGDESKKLHIGKSSAGWCFALHVTSGIQSLDDWKAEFSSGRIVDEYGEVLSVETMLHIIESRVGNHDWDRPWHGYRNEYDFHDKNHSTRGPNYLLRSRISKESRCVGHGDGTWDLIEGEFS